MRSRLAARAVRHSACARSAATLFRHRSANLRPKTPQSRGKRGKTRARGPATAPRVLAGNGPHSPVADPRLKLVVSPVRVRVSPSAEVAANARYICSAASGTGDYGHRTREPVPDLT